MAIPKIDIVKIMMPVIVRLFPELRVAEVVRGKIIPLKDVNPMNEAEEARALSREFKRQPRTDGTKDSSQVVNLDRAIKCVEEAGGKGGLVAKVVRKCVVVLLRGGQPGSNVTEDLLNPIVTCLRENALRQDTPRVVRTERAYQRPRKGHGHGRKGF